MFISRHSGAKYIFKTIVRGAIQTQTCHGKRRLDIWGGWGSKSLTFIRGNFQKHYLPLHFKLKQTRKLVNTQTLTTTAPTDHHAFSSMEFSCLSLVTAPAVWIAFTNSDELDGGTYKTRCNYTADTRIFVDLLRVRYKACSHFVHCGGIQGYSRNISGKCTWRKTSSSLGFLLYLISQLLFLTSIELRNKDIPSVYFK